MGRKNRINRNKKLQQQMSVVNEKEIKETPDEHNETPIEDEKIKETTGKYKEIPNENDEQSHKIGRAHV